MILHSQHDLATLLGERIPCQSLQVMLSSDGMAIFLPSSPCSNQHGIRTAGWSLYLSTAVRTTPPPREASRPPTPAISTIMAARGVVDVEGDRGSH